MELNRAPLGPRVTPLIGSNESLLLLPCLSKRIGTWHLMYVLFSWPPSSAPGLEGSDPGSAFLLFVPGAVQVVLCAMGDVDANLLFFPFLPCHMTGCLANNSMSVLPWDGHCHISSWKELNKHLLLSFSANREVIELFFSVSRVLCPTGYSHMLLPKSSLQTGIVIDSLSPSFLSSCLVGFWQNRCLQTAYLRCKRFLKNPYLQ